MDAFHQELAAFPGPRQSVHDDGDALDEDEAGDHEHWVPVKLERGPVPAETLSVVEDPDEGEEHRQKADEQRRHQQPQEAPVAVHGDQSPQTRAAQAAELGTGPAANAGVDFPELSPPGRRGFLAGQPRTSGLQAVGGWPSLRNPPHPRLVAAKSSGCAAGAPWLSIPACRGSSN